jgi:hypothetical protein
MGMRRTDAMMRKLFDHVMLLPGRALIRRQGPGYGWGEVIRPLANYGERRFFSRAEFTFQKGVSHYVVVFLRNTETYK